MHLLVSAGAHGAYSSTQIREAGVRQIAIGPFGRFWTPPPPRTHATSLQLKFNNAWSVAVVLEDFAHPIVHEGMYAALENKREKHWS